MFCFGLRKRLNALEAKQQAPELQKLVDEYYVLASTYHYAAKVAADKPGIRVSSSDKLLSAAEFIRDHLAPLARQRLNELGGYATLKPKPVESDTLFFGQMYNLNAFPNFTPPTEKPKKKRGKK